MRCIDFVKRFACITAFFHLKLIEQLQWHHLWLPLKSIQSDVRCASAGAGAGVISRLPKCRCVLGFRDYTRPLPHFRHSFCGNFERLDKATESNKIPHEGIADAIDGQCHLERDRRRSMVLAFQISKPFLCD